MPIYEYECSACGHRLEVIQKFSDAPLAECPACEKPVLIKLLSAPSFHLKGSGWYKTDFKDADKKKPSETEKAESAGEAKTAATTTEGAASTKDAAPAPATSKPAAAVKPDAA